MINRHAVANQSNPAFRNTVDLLEQFPGFFCHDHHKSTPGTDLAQHPFLSLGRRFQDSVERGDDRRPKLLIKAQDIATVFPAENPVLMLHADDIDSGSAHRLRSPDVVPGSLIADRPGGTRRDRLPLGLADHGRDAHIGASLG